MSVKRTAAGGWEISVCVNYQRVHRRLPPGTPAGDAKRIEAELRASLARNGGPVIPGDPTMAEVMATYIKHTKTLRSSDTAEYHALRIGRWLEGHRASHARQVSAAIVRDMTGHYAPATINRSLGALKRGLRLVWEAGRTVVNYADHVKRLPENNQRTTYLSVEEVDKIAQHASEAVRAAIWIALYTGCRRGEICKIQASDIGASVLRIQAGNTKTLRYREVPIAAPLRPWLKHLPLAINFEGLKSGFRRAREAAGMPEVNFHDLRRSCGTILLQSGTDLHTVSKILGHSTTKVTEARYAFLDDGKMLAAVDRAFGGGESFTPALAPGHEKGPTEGAS